MNLCVIPARGGSRRIPGKNIKEFNGKPIIAYSIETALASGLFDKIVVSTDSDEIAEVALHYGAQVLKRQPELAVDEVGTWEVVKNAAQTFEYVRYVCGIYTTSPLMLAGDLLRGHKLVSEYNFRHAVSVGYPPLQDAGQWYWSSEIAIEQDIEYFDHRTALVKIPAERVCDINTLSDWSRAEEMYAKLD